MGSSVLESLDTNGFSSIPRTGLANCIPENKDGHGMKGLSPMVPSLGRPSEGTHALGGFSETHELCLGQFPSLNHPASFSQSEK